MASSVRFLLALALISVSSAAVSRQCLDCICKVESRCRPLDCKMDGGSQSCGYYQIKRNYYIDCGQPGKRASDTIETAWRRCAKDKSCAEQCVQAYMNRYASRCSAGRGPSCETYARVHNGGPTGCRRTSTVNYWQKVQRC